MTEKIYVVQGSTGEYSDHNEWLVRAFRDENQAREFTVAADARARELFVEYQNNRWDTKGMHAMDPNFCMDYTGTHYTYFPVELT